MADYISMENLKFLLHEHIKVAQLTKLERYQEYDKESFDILIDSIKDYSDKKLFPVLRKWTNSQLDMKTGK